MKSIDDKIADLGFVKTKEDEYGVQYTRKLRAYVQVIDIIRKTSGGHLLFSYESGRFDKDGIGNTCVGLTYEEAKLFLKKMKKTGLHKA